MILDLRKDVESESRHSSVIPWSSMHGLSSWLDRSGIYPMGALKWERR